MYGNNNANKVFSIPVEWVVTENIEVKANSLEEAVRFVVDNYDEIPCGEDASFVDGTYRITGDDDFDGDISKVTENLKTYGYTERTAESYDTVDSEIGGAM